MNNRPIGVFDSGFGGLTVVSELLKALPNENIIYFGDNGRMPYGSKTVDTVVKFTMQNIRFLLTQNIKMLVIACNTASACALELIKEHINIPVIEVVEPGAVAAVNVNKNNKIGVIGTTATINSKVYEKAINKIKSGINIVAKPCPMFVPLVEEGWWENQVAIMVVEEYLCELKSIGIDTLVLGCTHYPLLINTIQKVMGSDVKLISSATEVSNFTKQALLENNIFTNQNTKVAHKFFTSDSVEKFITLGSHILDMEIKYAKKIDIEQY